MSFINFLDYLRFEKRCSPHTIIAYKADLEQLLEFTTTTYSINNLSTLDHQLIRSWLARMMEQAISARSINRKITTLKTFYRFLIRENIIHENPMLKIQSPKTAKRLPVFVEKEKMDLLLDRIEFGENFDGIRNKLILEMFYSTGIRLSELINLEQKNIDFHHSTIKVLGKRNKERIIPFNDMLRIKIKNYLNEKKQNRCPETIFFFCSINGKKMNVKYIYRLVNNSLNQVTTINKKSPHVLRHTFATIMLNNGADLNAIKELLGHASLASTQVYTHNTVEKLKNIYKLAHPKA